MQRLSLKAASVALLGLAYSASPAFGQEESQTTFGFQYSAIRYMSESEKVKPKNGSSTTTDSSEFNTTGEDSFATINHGDWYFYLFPFTGLDTIGLSKMVTDDLEVGTFLGLANEKTDENKRSSTKLDLTPFACYYVPVGNITLENYLSVNIKQQSIETTNPQTQVKSKTESDTLGATVSVGAVFPISKTLSYVPSIKYSTSTEEFKDDAEVKTDTFYVTPLAIRMKFH